METIDVIIPVYNGLPYVIETLNSVINQTRKPDRILVINDGSTDNTASECEKIKSLHPNLKIEIISKKNGGHSSATNEGIRRSNADYIALVDADDLWEPQKLEKQIEVFKKSSDQKLGVVYCNYGNIDQNSNKIFDFPCFTMEPKIKGNVFKLLLSRGNLIAGSNSAVLIKRECFTKTGYFFDEYLRCGEDWEMWINLSKHYHFDNCPDVLVYIRRHLGNLSNLNMIHMKSNLYILNKWINEINEIGGTKLVVEHLSNGTPNNLYQLFSKSEFKPLREYVKNLTLGFPSPRFIILLAIIKKIIRKIFRGIK